MPESLSAQQLARRVLDVLAKQQEYFRKRTNDLLQESKRMERDLKTECERILHPEQTQLNLFDPSANIGGPTHDLGGEG